MCQQPRTPTSCLKWCGKRVEISSTATAHAMRQIYQAGGWPAYLLGGWFHSTQIASYKKTARGSAPCGTRRTRRPPRRDEETSRRCPTGFDAELSAHRPGANQYNNPFSDEIALFETSEGRVAAC